MPPTHPFPFPPPLWNTCTTKIIFFPFALQQISGRELVKFPPFSQLLLVHWHNSLDKKIQGNQPVPSQVSACLFQEIYEWSGKLWNCQRHYQKWTSLSESCTISIWNLRHKCFSFSISNSGPSQFCGHLKSRMYQLWVFWSIHWWQIRFCAKWERGYTKIN
jgi:hypothetical protein